MRIEEVQRLGGENVADRAKRSSMLTDEIILQRRLFDLYATLQRRFSPSAVNGQPGSRIGHRTCVLVRLLLAHAGAGWPSWVRSRAE